MGYGRKNHVSLNILDYNLGILGEPKIGKTTLVKEICEKLVGEEGYTFIEIGSERGADAIEGIQYVNCPTWNMPYDELTNSIGIEEYVDDIVENKITDYPNLKVVVFDTIDQIIPISENKAISVYNRQNPEKKVNTINSAYGGYGRGEKEAMKLIQDIFDRLDSVGVKHFLIGHVKNKDVPDPITGETYQIITSDQQQNYFNAFRKNLHILGLAYIDRDIIREKTGKKDKEKKEITKGKITSQARKIKFRDDTYAVDAGGRFAEIEPEIDLNADAFIEAVQNAIMAEQKKSGMTYKESEVNQKKIDKAIEDRIKEEAKSKKEQTEIKEIIASGIDVIKECFSSNPDKAQTIMSFCTDNGYKNPGEINDLKIAREFKKLIDSL